MINKNSRKLLTVAKASNSCSISERIAKEHGMQYDVIGEELRSVIDCCLVVDPQSRMNAGQILEQIYNCEKQSYSKSNVFPTMKLRCSDLVLDRLSLNNKSKLTS